MTQRIERALKFFDVDPENLQEFDVEDPFNDHRLGGWLCRVGDHRYGALWIDTIDGKPHAPQVIWGTPKMGYPMDKNGVFHWPKMKKINAYDKLDGTNILAYRYNTPDGICVSYKTRLTPVLTPSKWGDFLGMWKELLERYPQIPAVVLENNINLSFEMYGTRNLHTIVYDIPLETVLLFGVAGVWEPRVVDPEDIDCDLPRPALQTCKSDATDFYQKLKAEGEAMNTKVEGLGIEGTEGYVLYAHCEHGLTCQFKAKPESIEAIHWAGGITKSSIRTTCQNAFESNDNPTVEDVKKLLLEEYNDKEIECRIDWIKIILEEVYEEMDFRSKILDLYKKNGISILEDKTGCMRAIAPHFSKKDMKKVFWVINNCTK